jgi:hemolysin activation/secretion protein
MPKFACLQRLNRAAALALACAAACVLPALALAQAPPTPGAVQDTLGPRKPPVKAPPAQMVFPKPPPPVTHDPKARRFTVNAFQFVGNTVYSTQTLKRLTERYIDLQLNLNDLSRAADSVTRFYQDNGYPVARAVLPAQKVDKGIVRIEVIEGRVGEVRFEGSRRYTPEFLRWRLTALKPGELITTDGLEQDLLLLNDLPGLSARAVLEPGKEFGTTDVAIRVEEKIASAMLRPNNHGRKEIGQWRMDAGASLNNPLGLGDQLSIYSIYSENSLLKYGRASYSLPITSRGTRLEFAVSSSNYSVAGDIAALGVTGDALNRELTVTHPFFRTRAQSLTLNVGARSTHLRQRVFGVETSSTSIDLVNAGLTYNQIGEDASVTNASAQASTNLKGNDLGTRSDAERFKLDLEVSQLRGLSREWDGFVRGVYVYSPERLADSEKFSLGGPGSVRGYRPSELRGDGGVLLTGEVRHPFQFANRLGIWGFFYDYGLVRFKATPGLVDGTEKLQSVGTGVTYYLHPSVTLKLEFAVPVGNTIRSDGRDHGRAWISITGTF